MKSKQLRFADLVARVENCKLCSRMGQRRPVLSLSNGNLNVLAVFIAEAPGRLGADKFGIPLFGDQTARNFDWFISKVSINRDSIFITNAVLCNPRKSDGNNASPTNLEILTCSKYLKEVLQIIRPEYVVPMGRVALASLHIIHPHVIKLSQDVGQLYPWNGSQIYPLFHPGSRALIRRGKTEQLDDYKNLALLLGSIIGKQL